MGDREHEELLDVFTQPRSNPSNLPSRFEDAAFEVIAVIIRIGRAGDDLQDRIHERGRTGGHTGLHARLGVPARIAQLRFEAMGASESENSVDILLAHFAK